MLIVSLLREREPFYQTLYSLERKRSILSTPHAHFFEKILTAGDYSETEGIQEGLSFWGTPHKAAVQLSSRAGIAGL